VGKSADYGQGRALFPEDVLGWPENSQPAAMDKLRAMNGAGTETVVLDRLVKQLENKVDGGTINVLRYGFSVAGGGTLAMSQALPADERNDTVFRRSCCRNARKPRMRTQDLFLGRPDLPAFPTVGRCGQDDRRRARGRIGAAVSDPAQRWLRQDQHHRLDRTFADSRAPPGW
jgi:hypothetical protein